MVRRFIGKFEYNAPVALTFAILSFFVLCLSWATDGVSTSRLFCCYASSWANPLTYVRLFGHVLGHANLSHYVNNIMLLLLLGPIVEECYGSGRLVGMMAITAGITGLVNMLFFPGTALLGASGVVFMMIILSALSCRHQGRIPLTFVAVTALYLGQEVYNLFFVADNISQISHLIGGAVGLVCGLTLRRN